MRTFDCFDDLLALSLSLDFKRFSLRSHLYCQIIHGPNNDHVRAYRVALDSTTHQWPINFNRRRHEGNKVKWRKRTTTKEEAERKNQNPNLLTSHDRNIESKFCRVLIFTSFRFSAEELRVSVSFDFDSMRRTKEKQSQKTKERGERASERAK